jgi:radical SAM superfamily enzyme YgiQ (UPF0313 family)
MEECRYGVKAGARWASIRRRRETLQYYPFPFFMAYATALLKAEGFDARLKDAVAEEMNTEQALRFVEEYAPDLCVIETATPSIAMDLAFAEQVKARTGAVTVMSGPHASALPEEVLREQPACDIALIGEYDYTLLELARLGPGADLSQVKGIAYRDGDRIVRNEPRPLIEDLDSLPYPERDDIPIEKYTDPTCKRYPNVCIISSRGCPYSCIFCVEPSVYYGKPNFRARSPENVVDEIEFVMERYRAAEIYFDDSSFSIDLRRARRICEEILSRGLDIWWSCMADVRTDYETLELMYRAGCRGMKFGVESASPEILKNARKNLDLRQVKEFVRNCHRIGIYTHGTFMFGLPGETRETIRQTLELAFELKVTTAQFSVATPFPGTEFYRLAQEQGWLRTTDWAAFEGAESPVIEYPQCSAEDILAGIRESKRRKMIRVATNPPVLWQYMRKIYDMEGLSGLLRNLWEKGSFVIKAR